MPNWVRNSVTFTGDEEKIKEIKERVQEGEYVFSFNKLIPMPEDLLIVEGSQTMTGAVAYIISEYQSKEIYDWDNEDPEVLAMHKICDYRVSGINGIYERAVQELKELPDEYEGVEYNAENITSFCRTKKELIELGRKAISNVIKYGYTSWYGWCCDKWGTKWDACDGIIVEDEPEILTYEFDTAWDFPQPIADKLAEEYPDVTIRWQYADEDVFSDNCGDLLYNRKTSDEGGC